MRVSLFCLLLMMVVPAAAFAQASNVYVTPGGTATGNCPAGTSSAPNLTPAGFNNGVNWGAGPGKISAGTTVLVCGTFTEPAGTANLLTFQAGGSSGNPIVLKLDSSANLTSPSWSGVVIYANNLSYITVDGLGTGSIIQSTLNGSSNATCAAGTCTYQNEGSCVVLQGGNYLTVQNVNCQDMYVHYCASGNYNDSSCGDTNGISSGCISVNYGNNLTIQNNTCPNDGDAIVVGEAYGTAYQNVTIANNTISHACIGIQFSNNMPSGTFSNLTVSGNQISDGYNWAIYPTPSCHVDGMHLFTNNSGVVVSGTKIYDNFIHGSWGTAVNAFIFVENGGNYSDGTEWAGTQVFNNILEDDSTIGHNGDGGIAVSGSNDIVANNTCNGISPCIFWWNANLTAENNTIYHSGSGSVIAYVMQSVNGASISKMDYDNYYGVGNWDSASGGDYPTLASWQAACSCDSHATNTSPLFSGGALSTPVATQLTTNYIPSASSAALVKYGANLTSLSISPLDTDYAGNSRPGAGTCSSLGSSSCWDIGAYSSASINGTVLPPTGLIATVE